jgi:hypothetical protein
MGAMRLCALFTLLKPINSTEAATSSHPITAGDTAAAFNSRTV